MAFDHKWNSKSNLNLICYKGSDPYEEDIGLMMNFVVEDFAE